MSPVTHLLTGWIVANAPSQLDHRTRAVITLASIAPDLDGIGIIPEILTRGSNHPLLWYSSYHHVLCHNLAFGLALVLAGWRIGARRWLTAFLVLLSFHLHIAGDLIGSRSPNGCQWPIRYLYPFSNSCELAWNGQWQLNAGPNYLITSVALVVVLALACWRGYSPVGILSARADRIFVETLRRRWRSYLAWRSPLPNHLPEDK